MKEFFPWQTLDARLMLTRTRRIVNDDDDL